MLLKYVIIKKCYKNIFLKNIINSFAANVTDRRRHSRLPTSPIGDLDTHYLEGMQHHTKVPKLKIKYV